MASVAVIGAGVNGIVSTKNLLEEGFSVTCFESRDAIGGTWRFTDRKDVTSVLPTTIANVSKFRNCFTDFPCDLHTPTFFKGDQTLEYLQSYAEHFGLWSYIQLNTRVLSIEPTEDGEWQVKWQNHDQTSSQIFQKVLLCNGRYLLPRIPQFEGQDSTAITISHSQSFKNPRDYKGKNVVIVGIGSTAADTVCELAGVANKHALMISQLSRWIGGKPLDLLSNRRRFAMIDTIARLFPMYWVRTACKAIDSISTSCFSFKPEWHMSPRPSPLTTRPVISDAFVPRLNDGSVVSLPGLKRFVGHNSIEVVDSTILENIDNVIFCTGYRADYSVLLNHEQVVDFSRPSKLSPTTAVPRLYQNVFVPRYANSLAVMNNWYQPDGICPVADLVTMAIAQVWKGAFKLPSIREMEKSIDARMKWACDVEAEALKQCGVAQLAIDSAPQGQWMEWLHRAAGTGVNENLGYGLQGWWFWLTNRRWCNTLMGMLDSPHAMRLFRGRRKRWDGAADAIVAANMELQLRLVEHEEEMQEEAKKEA